MRELTYMSSRQASMYCMEGHTIRTEFTRLSVQGPRGCSSNESGIKFLATTFGVENKNSRTNNIKYMHVHKKSKRARTHPIYYLCTHTHQTKQETTVQNTDR